MAKKPTTSSPSSSFERVSERNGGGPDQTDYLLLSLGGGNVFRRNVPGKGEEGGYEDEFCQWEKDLEISRPNHARFGKIRALLLRRVNVTTEFVATLALAWQMATGEGGEGGKEGGRLVQFR